MRGENAGFLTGELRQAMTFRSGTYNVRAGAGLLTDEGGVN